MPPILKGRGPALMFGGTLAIGIVLLAGAALVTTLSSGISEEQRASQAVFTAFGYQEEDCDDVGSTQRPFWCGSLFHTTSCYLRVSGNAQTRYYDCYDPPEGSVDGGNTGPGRWACVADRGADRGMTVIAVHGGRADDQNPCRSADEAYAAHPG